jgi:hypothetical protein
MSWGYEMACDFCREIERVTADQSSGTVMYVTLNDRLTVDTGYGFEETASFTIKYCPMCGQDLREVINADS